MINRLLGGMALALAMSVSLMAEPVIDFGGGGTGGTISSGGLGSAVVGSGISINQIIAAGAPAGDGSYTVPGLTLNFQTGNVKSVTPVYGGYQYTYDGGGSFQLSGAFPAAGIATNQTLVSGSFWDGSFTITNFGGGYLVQFSGSGPESLNSSLLNYFGLSDTAYKFTGFSMVTSMNGTIGNNGAFSASGISSTDFVNTSAPEPSAILLLGTCLLFIGGALRKKLNRSKAL